VGESEDAVLKAIQRGCPSMTPEEDASLRAWEIMTFARGGASQVDRRFSDASADLLEGPAGYSPCS